MREFKTMMKTLRSAGVEVILDVVYNHTAEGNHLGPTLSFLRIDNAAYCRLVDDDARYNMDCTGCGNSLNVRHPRTLQLIVDSLRYWVLDMADTRSAISLSAGPNGTESSVMRSADLGREVEGRLRSWRIGFPAAAISTR